MSSCPIANRFRGASDELEAAESLMQGAERLLCECGDCNAHQLENLRVRITGLRYEASKFDELYVEWLADRS